MTAEPHTSIAMRASDADRERVVELLRDHAAAGRLDVEELDQRTEAAYRARTLDALEALSRDLPDDPLRAPEPARVRIDPGLARRLAPYVLVNLALIAIWAATGGGYFWPLWPLLGWGIGLASHGRRPPGGGRCRALEASEAAR